MYSILCCTFLCVQCAVFWHMKWASHESSSVNSIPSPKRLYMKCPWSKGISSDVFPLHGCLFYWGIIFLHCLQWSLTLPVWIVLFFFFHGTCVCLLLFWFVCFSSFLLLFLLLACFCFVWLLLFFFLASGPSCLFAFFGRLLPINLLSTKQKILLFLKSENEVCGSILQMIRVTNQDTHFYVQDGLDVAYILWIGTWVDHLVFDPTVVDWVAQLRPRSPECFGLDLGSTFRTLPSVGWACTRFSCMIAKLVRFRSLAYSSLAPCRPAWKAWPGPT